MWQRMEKFYFIQQIYRMMRELPLPSLRKMEDTKGSKSWKKAEEQGLLLRLPCKVGDTLYRVNKGAKEPVIMMRVIQLYIKQIHKDRTVMRIDAINDTDMGESCYLPCDIGERIFLTREEAEAKLKEMEGESDVL